MNANTYSLENVLNARARLGECPLWDNERKLLYWVDIYNYRVHQFNPSTKSDRFFEVGDAVGSIALAGKNRLLLALRDRLAFLNLQTEEVTSLIALEADKPDTRLNDGKCDRQGRFWFGSMHDEKPEASLYRYDPDGSLQVMETGLTISNGLGWSPDEKTFFLTDSPTQKIYAYDFDAKTGQIDNRRVFVDLRDESFVPDGLTIDSEGYLWSAMWDGWCVIRFDPQGQEVLRIPMPVQCPTCCTFGGEQLQDLYITTASVGLSQKQIQKSFYSGDLFCLKTDVCGMPSHSY